MSSPTKDIQITPINNLQKYQPEWSVRVRVVRRGSIDTYSSARSSGQRWKVILIDDEGTTIHALFFNAEVEKFRQQLWKDESYIISNGQVSPINKKFPNVHDCIELKILSTTTIIASEISVTNSISYKFKSFKDAALQGETKTLFDVLGVVVKVNSRSTPKKNNDSVYKMKEVIIMNMSEEYMRVTLWGDLEDNEGPLLESIVNQNPIIALSKVRGSIYEEEFFVSTLVVSTLEINPVNDESSKMQSWVKNTLAARDWRAFSSPARRMNKSHATTIKDIVQGNISKSPGFLCSFKAIVMEVLNKDDLWYEACKECSRRVEMKDEGAYCGTCKTNLSNYIHKYRVKLRVCDEEEKEIAIVTLFDAAEQLIGCPAAEFAQLTKENKYNSKVYRNLLNCTGNKYKMLTKLNKKKETELQMNQIVVDELEEVEDDIEKHLLKNKRVRRELILD